MCKSKDIICKNCNQSLFDVVSQSNGMVKLHCKICKEITTFKDKDKSAKDR